MNCIDEFENILNSENITTLFQPIVRFRDGEIIGYEALSRGPRNSSFHSPLKLLKMAEAQNRLWDLELLFRTKAIEKASALDNEALLFINVDPHIIKDPNFKKGFTKEFLYQHNISPKSIIFEITERTAIEDYKSFTAILQNYVNQGYKIAIDDAGAGYSGLRTITETKPHYVKLDMDLIRNIHDDFFKQAIIKSFVSLCSSTNIKLIAEGIETREELQTLISLGIYAGQGYFLNRPTETFLNISEDIKSTILKYNTLYSNGVHFNDKHQYIGDIIEQSKTFHPSITCKEIKDYFDHNPVESVCITNDNYPIGLLMKHSLNSTLAKQYGFAVYSNRPISKIMDHNPLIVDCHTLINTVSEYAMSRNDNKIYDNIVVTKDSKYYGMVSIKKLLQYTITLEKNYARELNPLTLLPGNVIINHVLKDTILYDEKSCVFYLDIDNFKICNDIYGFENGDKVIKLTAEIIKNNVQSLFPINSFVGHIGGDDFICVVHGSINKCKNLCDNILSEFDLKVFDFFSQKGIHYLPTLSIAVLYDSFDQFLDPDELAQYMSTLKGKVKKQKHSSYIIHP